MVAYSINDYITLYFGTHASGLLLSPRGGVLQEYTVLVSSLYFVTQVPHFVFQCHIKFLACIVFHL